MCLFNTEIFIKHLKNVVKKKYGDKAQLLFTDTDSLTYHIETDNIDIDLHKMRNYFDFSNPSSSFKVSIF